MDRRIARRPPESLFQLVTDAWTKPYWDAAAEGRLAIPRCAGCGTFRMPPTPFCPRCRSQALDWVAVSGRGTLYSYSVVERAIVPDMEQAVPYVTAVVELADAGGVRLITNIVDARIGDLTVGAPVRAVFDRRADGVAVPRFVLDAHGEGPAG
ncbi:Zn-ribbon domain-containing OB-fold protein [Azospirillum sp. sgz302134]